MYDIFEQYANDITYPLHTKTALGLFLFWLLLIQQFFTNQNYICSRFSSETTWQSQYMDYFKVSLCSPYCSIWKKLRFDTENNIKVYFFLTLGV